MTEHDIDSVLWRTYDDELEGVGAVDILNLMFSSCDGKERFWCIDVGVSMAFAQRSSFQRVFVVVEYAVVVDIVLRRMLWTASNRETRLL